MQELATWIVLLLGGSCLALWFTQWAEQRMLGRDDNPNGRPRAVRTSRSAASSERSAP